MTREERVLLTNIVVSGALVFSNLIFLIYFALYELAFKGLMQHAHYSFSTTLLLFAKVAFSAICWFYSAKLYEAHQRRIQHYNMTNFTSWFRRPNRILLRPHHFVMAAIFIIVIAINL